MSRDRDDRDDDRGRGRDRDSRDDRDDDRGRGRDRDDSRDRGRDRDSRDDDRGGRSRGRSVEEAVAFRYRERDPEKAKQRAESGGSSNDPWFNNEVTIFKAKEGDNEIRPLPPTWDDAEHYGYEVYMHFGVGPDNAAYLCLNKMKGQPCPVCEERMRVLDDKDPDEEYANELRPQKRVAAYIVDRAQERQGAMLWAISARQDSDFMLLQVDKKDGSVLNIDHPENGYDLQFHRAGQGLKTRYSGYQVARRSSRLDNDKALKFAVDHPIPDQLIFYSYDHIKRAFRGGSPGSSSSREGSNDRGSSRDRDERPSRDRDERDDDRRPPRDRDERDSRSNDDRRNDERDRSSSSKSRETWESVHEMGFRALCDLIKDERLKVDPDSTRDDAELADRICEELDLERPGRGGRDRDDAPRGGGRTRAVLNDDSKDEREESPRDRLRNMRERN